MKASSYLKLVGLSIIIAIGLHSCGSEEKPVSEPQIDQPKYEVKGRLLNINEDNLHISVVHEEIPGVMNAMRMNINIKTLDDTKGISSGDIISFTLTREGISWYATDFQKLSDDTVLDLPENLQEIGL